MKNKPLTNEEGEVRELLTKDIKAMRPAKEALPSSLIDKLPKRKRGDRGLQKHPTKIPVTLRYSAEVIEYFKATGPGWQIRMDKALKEWIKEHSQAA